MPLRVRTLHLAFVAFLLSIACDERAVAEEADGGKSGAVAIAAELAVQATTTRLTLKLSKPVEARAFVLERPDRAVIDLPEVNFQLDPDTGTRRAGVVSSFRYGLFAPGRSRIVVDLAGPALVDAIETTNGKDGSALLTIAFRRAERDSFVKAAVGSDPAPSQRQPLPTPDGGDRRPLVVLDAGHGGIDPGASAAGGIREKDIVFAFAQSIAEQLRKAGRYRVLMTRDSDIFVPLAERVRIAREAKADLFISIHADSLSHAPQVRGATIYTRAEEATDSESAKLAERENEADAAAGTESNDGTHDVADILQELTIRETRGFSAGFAGRLVSNMRPVMEMGTRAHREARFLVLRSPDVPSVLVELGYLSSKRDLAMLKSEQWRAKVATSMVSAINLFFAGRSNAPVPGNPPATGAASASTPN